MDDRPNRRNKVAFSNFLVEGLNGGVHMSAVG